MGDRVPDGRAVTGLEEYMTNMLPTSHAAFLDQARGILSADPRIHTLLAGGSLIHGGMDEFSDLDFVVVVEDASYTEVLASRMDMARRLGPLLSAFTGEHVGEPRLLICLYGPELLHIDLKFVTMSDLDRLVERPIVLWSRDEAAVEERLDRADISWPNLDPDWFEARAWIWLHYGAARALRGELFEAVGMLAFFRDQVLGPMLHRRAGRPQRGVRRIEAYKLDDTGQLAATVARHDLASVKAGLVAAVELYLELRADEPPRSEVKGMPQALLDFLGHEPDNAARL
jgi:predicted nucleotidyltransferase